MSALCLEGHTFFPFILSVFKLASFPKLINAFKYLLLLRKGRKESREEGREEEGKEKDSRQTRKKDTKKEKEKIRNSSSLFLCFGCTKWHLSSQPGGTLHPSSWKCSLNRWATEQVPTLLSYLVYFTSKLLEKQVTHIPNFLPRTHPSALCGLSFPIPPLNSLSELPVYFHSDKFPLAPRNAQIKCDWPLGQGGGFTECHFPLSHDQAQTRRCIQ